MSWNWIKIKSKDDLPDFKRTVLLYEKAKDGKEYVVVGSLKSIDAEGYHWSYGNSFDDIFGSFFGTQSNPNDFKPTHWCEIMRPEPELETGPIKYKDLKPGMYVKVTFLDDENDNKKTEETGHVDLVNWERKSFVLRHDKKKHSVRAMNVWEEIELLEKPKL